MRYAPSHTTIDVVIDPTEIDNGGPTPKTDLLLPALLIGCGMAGAAVIISGKKKVKK